MPEAKKIYRYEYLYDDAYEGLLKLALVVAPILIGWFYNYSNNNVQEFVVPFLLCIINQFVSARILYKDLRFESSRIKVENMLILLALVASILWALYIWIPTADKGNLQTKDFKGPVYLFAFSLMMNAFEIGLTFFGKDLKLDQKIRRKKRTSDDYANFDLTVANKN